jgi:hypothetical protein
VPGSAAEHAAVSDHDIAAAGAAAANFVKIKRQIYSPQITGVRPHRPRIAASVSSGTTQAPTGVAIEVLES